MYFGVTCVIILNEIGSPLRACATWMNEQQGPLVQSLAVQTQGLAFVLAHICCAHWPTSDGKGSLGASLSVSISHAGVKLLHKPPILGLDFQIHLHADLMH